MKMVFSAVAVIVLFGAGIGFAYYRSNQPQQAVFSSSRTEVSENDDGEMNDKETMEDSKSLTTLRDLFASGSQLECTYSQEDETIVVSGKVYLDGERMRGSFTTSDPENGNVDGSVLNDGEYMYTWGGPLEDQGIKLKIPGGSILENNEELEFSNFDQVLDIVCNDWAVDESFFIPPSTIEFNDIVAELETVIPIPSDEQCEICNTIPEVDVQNKCLEALGC
jgi:hypothetical protein